MKILDILQSKIVAIDECIFEINFKNTEDIIEVSLTPVDGSKLTPETARKAKDLTEKLAFVLAYSEMILKMSMDEDMDIESVLKNTIIGSLNSFMLMVLNEDYEKLYEVLPAFCVGLTIYICSLRKEHKFIKAYFKKFTDTYMKIANEMERRIDDSEDKIVWN